MCNHWQMFLWQIKDTVHRSNANFSIADRSFFNGRSKTLFIDLMQIFYHWWKWFLRQTSLATISHPEGGYGTAQMAFGFISVLRPSTNFRSFSARSITLTTLFLGKYQYLVHILSPVTDNCSSWISGRGRMAIEIFSWPSLHERMCRMWGSNSALLACLADTFSIELPRPVHQTDYILVKKRFRSGIKTARTQTFPAVDVGSDHDMMKTFQTRLKKSKEINPAKNRKRPRGRAVSAPDFGSWGRGFESRWRRDSSRT